MNKPIDRPSSLSEGCEIAVPGTEFSAGKERASRSARASSGLCSTPVVHAPHSELHADRLSRLNRYLLPVMLIPILILMGCPRSPVQETLEICLGAEDAMGFLVDISFPGPTPAEGSAVEDRLIETRRALEDGDHAWHERFDRLDAPATSGQSTGRSLEVLERFRRWAVAEDGDLALGRLFADTPLDASYLPGDEWGSPAELIFRSMSGSRASRDEEHLVETQLVRFSEAVTDYYTSVTTVFEFVDANPTRSRAVLEALFAGLLTDDVDPLLLSQDEEELVATVSESEELLLEVFEVEDGRALSLHELSARVFDPLPSDLRVHANGRVLQADGFALSGGVAVAERRGLWDAVERLEGRFVSPDPLLEQLRPKEERRSLDALVNEALRGSQATVLEVRNALREELKPRDEYRLVFQPDPDALGSAFAACSID